MMAIVRRLNMRRLRLGVGGIALALPLALTGCISAPKEVKPGDTFTATLVAPGPGFVPITAVPTTAVSDKATPGHAWVLYWVTTSSVYKTIEVPVVQTGKTDDGAPVYALSYTLPKNLCQTMKYPDFGTQPTGVEVTVQWWNAKTGEVFWDLVGTANDNHPYGSTVSYDNLITDPTSPYYEPDVKKNTGHISWTATNVVQGKACKFSVNKP